MNQPSVYQQYTLELLSYEEVRVVLSLLKYLAIIATAWVVIIVLLHVLFIAGYSSPLYQRRTPQRGWTKRLLPMSALVVFSLIGISYLINWLLVISL